MFCYQAVHPTAPAISLSATRSAPALAVEAGRMRLFVGDQLARWRVSDEDQDTAVLIAGELLANAVQHGRSHMTLSLALHAGLLSICVTDHGAPRTPHPTSRPADEHGRGLAIVAALAGRVEFVRDGLAHRASAFLDIAGAPTLAL